MYCKDCKFWVTDVLPTTRMKRSSNTWNCCVLVDIFNYDSAVNDTQCVIYADADDNFGLETELETGPMFGCVNFVQKKV